MERKPIKILIMSVGCYDNNSTVHMFEGMGAADNCVVCLPSASSEHVASYEERGIEVYVYDEKKYINKSFEYFGFKPRNCGGVGRQGIAEATEHYGDKYLCFQCDDDYIRFSIVTPKETAIKKWSNLAELIYLFDEFYRTTGVECMARTGATRRGTFFVNRKIFNNFIMRKGNRLNFDGFAALCSDDQRFNVYHNLLQCTPMLSTTKVYMCFAQNQGDRKDGNAPMYNGDCSWKKSFALKMMFPWAISQYVKKEANRVLFREHIEASKLYPPVFLEQDGKIVSKVIINKH